IVEIVDAQMAKILRIVTIERGLDPRDFTMIAFGGNGPLHGCALAEELGIARVLVPRHPGLYSAHGLLVAELRARAVAPVLREAAQLDAGDLERLFARLEDDGRRTLREQGVAEDAISFSREYDARYRGQSFEIGLPHEPTIQALIAAFHERHRQRYGYAVPEETVEIVNARSTAIGTLPERVRRPVAARARTGAPAASRKLWLEGGFVEAPVYARDGVARGAAIDGPAFVEQYDACGYVPPGWSARDDGEYLRLERGSHAAR
ncbi:MAG: hydantoinase/oxoprolinase family protein, partial [Vulcanimicrobiaceae bacterium]